MREKYEQGCWPLAVLPLLFAGVAAVVVFHASALALGALVAIAAPVALTEVLLWRAMQAKSTSEVDTFWPWYPRLRTALEVLVVYAVIVASGAMKGPQFVQRYLARGRAVLGDCLWRPHHSLPTRRGLVGPLDGSSR